MSVDVNDRLGAAIKQIAAGMAEHGRDRVRLTVAIGKIEAMFEIRLVRVHARKQCRRVACATGARHGNDARN